LDKEILLMKKKAYREKNKVKIAKYRRQYYLKNRDKEIAYAKKYNHNNKDKIDITSKIYRQSEQGKLVHKTAKNKRRRNMKTVEILPNIFSEEVLMNLHHINNLLVVPLPTKVHLKVLGKEHKKHCKNAINDYYCINIDKLFGG